jgi:hypothetical protein
MFMPLVSQTAAVVCESAADRCGDERGCESVAARASAETCDGSYNNTWLFIINSADSTTPLLTKTLANQAVRHTQ